MRHFVLTDKAQTKHTALQMETGVLAWRSVQRVQICPALLWVSSGSKALSCHYSDTINHKSDAAS